MTETAGRDETIRLAKCCCHVATQSDWTFACFDTCRVPRRPLTDAISAHKRPACLGLTLLLMARAS